jgi:hypothetical protein
VFHAIASGAALRAIALQKVSLNMNRKIQIFRFFPKAQVLKTEQLEALCRALLRMSGIDDLGVWLETNTST